MQSIKQTNWWPVCQSLSQTLLSSLLRTPASLNDDWGRGDVSVLSPQPSHNRQADGGESGSTPPAYLPEAQPVFVCWNEWILFFKWTDSQCWLNPRCVGQIVEFAACRITRMGHSCRYSSLLICLRWWVSSSLVALQCVACWMAGKSLPRDLHRFCITSTRMALPSDNLVVYIPPWVLPWQISSQAPWVPNTSLVGWRGNPLSPGLGSGVWKHRHFVVISSYQLLYSEQLAAGVAQVNVSALSVKAVMFPQAAS